MSLVSGMGILAEAGKRIACEPSATGWLDVRSDEKGAGPVMWSWRVDVLLPAAMARVNAREACMAVV